MRIVNTFAIEKKEKYHKRKQKKGRMTLTCDHYNLFFSKYISLSNIISYVICITSLYFFLLRTKQKSQTI